MNRILRNDGAWHRRNGPKGTGIAWFWDINEGLFDTLNLQTNLLQFSYTPAGNIPEGAQIDILSLDSNVVQFSYTPAGNIPEGAYNDDLTLDTNVVSFSYTL